MIRLLIALSLSSLLAACANMQSASEPAGASQSVIPEAAVNTDERRRARIRLELAAGHYQQRNYSVALDELREALTIDPDYPAAYGMLGLIYMDLNEPIRAETSFKKALELAPGNADLSNNYGWFLCRFRCSSKRPMTGFMAHRPSPCITPASVCAELARWRAPSNT